MLKAERTRQKAIHTVHADQEPNPSSDGRQHESDSPIRLVSTKTVYFASPTGAPYMLSLAMASQHFPITSRYTVVVLAQLCTLPQRVSVFDLPGDPNRINALSLV
uniref:AMP_N domain-containing protein n=1 Tax=Panagrellus redivivus TaxID=6233 RepID=A0A7E4VP83_PANRE